MVGRSDWIQKRGLYHVGYGKIEREVIKKHIRKDSEGNHVGVRQFLIPGVKKAEPLDAYGWITLVSRVGSLGGIIYLVIQTLGKVI
jgi:hypothetical protein